MKTAAITGGDSKLIRTRMGFFIFAERLSSAINVLGAEHAARSMIRDKHVYSL
jgi:hypothetical protein